MREYRTVVEYDGDSDDQLVYGPDMEDGAEGRATKAAKRWRGRDFESSVISVECREVGPWETVRSAYSTDRTPPHPVEHALAAVGDGTREEGDGDV